MFALVATTRRISLPNTHAHTISQHAYTPYTFPRLYNQKFPHTSTETQPQVVEPALDIQAYSVRVEQQHNNMRKFIEKVRRNTQNMKDSDLKDFAMELVEDCQSWADCWKLAADIAGEAWKAFRKAGVVIEEEVHAILDKSRSLGEQAIRRAIRNSRRVLRLARKYPAIYEGQREEWDELEQFVDRVDRMIEGQLKTDQESVAELRGILDCIHSWHERALEKIRVTGGELDPCQLDGEWTSSDDEDAKSEEFEPGAQRRRTPPFAEGAMKNLDALDCYVTAGGEDDRLRGFGARHPEVEEHLHDVYDELKKSDIQWKWVSQIVNSLNLITVITFTGVGIVGLFLRRSSPDKNKGN